MKKAIVLNALGNSSWIGGLYYKKNILFVILQNDWIKAHYNIVVVTEKENRAIFVDYGTDIRLITIGNKQRKSKIQRNITRMKLILIAIIFRGKYIYPFSCPKLCRPLGIVDITWIPDFQDCYYPELFSKEEVEARKKNRDEVAAGSIPLILSSNTCREDFYRFTESNKKNVYVVPFVSNIEKEVRKLTDDYTNGICKKFGVENRQYILVSNQFWPHKNHELILDMLDYVSQKSIEFDPVIVLTGRLPDEDSEYGKKITGRFREYEAKGHVVLAGFTDRTEQLALMKGAAFVLQPSLFEGWGTVVEDAKVLDKKILLSDIPVHREQMNEKCILFNPNNPFDLAKTIISESKKDNIENIGKSIDKMYMMAQVYSEGLLKIFDNQ